MPSRRTVLRPTLLAMAIALTLPMGMVSPAQAATINQPAQDLGDALNALASQTGLRLLFATDLVKGKRAPALNGDYSPEQALRQLLTGSGLEAVATGDGSFAIRALPQGSTQQLDEVTVTAQSDTQNPTGPVQGYVVQRTTAGKTNAPVLELAQSLTVITRDAMEDRGVQTVSDAISYAPGTLIAAYGQDPRYDWTFLRGFNALSDQWRDGLRTSGRGFNLPKVNPYGLERVEIIRGPASVLYGQGNPGGLISMTTKRPTETPYHEVGIAGGSYGNKQVFADVSDRLDESGEWRYRLTLHARDADSAIDHAESHSYYIAPAITWTPSDNTSITFLMQYQSEHSTDLYNGTPSQQLKNLAAFFGIPMSTIPSNRNIGNPDFEKFDRDYFSFGYALEHRINDTWSLNQNVRYESIALDYNYAVLVGFLPPGILGSETLLTQNAVNIDEPVKNLLLDQNLTGSWKTGTMDYTLVAGLDIGWTDAERQERTSDPDPMAAGIIALSPTSPLYSYTLNAFNANPSYPAIVAPTTLTEDSSAKNRKIGVYVQNRFRFQENWLLNLAGRQDWVTTETDDRLTGTPATQNDNAFSGQASLMYVSESGVAPYVSYSTGFNPILETDNNGNPMDPETATQYEVGIKWQPNTNVLLSLAGFDLTKQNIVSADPNGQNKTQTGEIRSLGLEAEATLSLDNGLKLTTSYTHINAEITEDQRRPTFVGSTPELVAENTAAAWVDYTLQDGPLKGIGVGAGARYVGSMHYMTDDLVTGTSGTEIDLKGYTLYDAALRYKWQNWSLSLTGQNLAGKEYLAWCSSQICQWGLPRSFIATARYRW